MHLIHYKNLHALIDDTDTNWPIKSIYICYVTSIILCHLLNMWGNIYIQEYIIFNDCYVQKWRGLRKVSQSPVSVDCMIIDNNNVARTDF